MCKQEELEEIQEKKKEMTLSLAQIRDMVNKDVVIYEVGDNAIEFIDNKIKSKPFTIASGYYTQITPSDLKDAKQFFKKEHQQWLDKAGEFDLLRKEEKVLKKELAIESECN